MLGLVRRRFPRFHPTRDSALWALGFSGLAWQLFIVPRKSPEALFVCVWLVGGPLIFQGTTKPPKPPEATPPVSGRAE